MDELNKTLEALKDALNEEIKKVTKKNDITPVELENMTKTLCLIEKIKMVEEGESYWDDGQSGRTMRVSYGMGGEPYGRQNGYYDGMSGEQNGRQSGHYDGMVMDPHYGMSGRRMRSSRTGRYMSGSSYDMPDPGYSGHSIKDRMIAKLEEMYDDAKTDHEKKIVDEWIERIAEER